VKAVEFARVASLWLQGLEASAPSLSDEPPQKRVAGNGDRCYFWEAVREDEEVVPVNVSTWVLLFGVTVGR
jgi:hypothetical protein